MFTALLFHSHMFSISLPSVGEMCDTKEDEGVHMVHPGQPPLFTNTINSTNERCSLRSNESNRDIYSTLHRISHIIAGGARMNDACNDSC